jgi:hypothetical protein
LSLGGVTNAASENISVISDVKESAEEESKQIDLTITPVAESEQQSVNDADSTFFGYQDPALQKTDDGDSALEG